MIEDKGERRLSENSDLRLVAGAKICGHVMV